MTRRVCVVVLGDITRSPRMRNHALSLARHVQVSLIGYATHPEREPPELNVLPLATYPPDLPHSLPPILNYFVKTIWQTINLLMLLILNGRFDAVFCQNPPAIPTLFVCWIYCLFARAKFIIDWHNYGHSIMAITRGERSTIVRVSKWIEYYFGRKADANFCVSQAMKNDLLQNYNIQCKLLYDCPPDSFRPINNQEKHYFISKLSNQYPEFASKKSPLSNELSSNGVITERTILTEKNSLDVVTLCPKRPGVLFSSTSWTEDEDFMILLKALEDYDTSAFTDSSLPDLLCVITGKGPMKDFYMDLIASKRLHKVKIITPWLEAADYPLMVASADLGVCLHTSSSGLDLPMKIVDMFGSGLPVCAYKYPCLKELVNDGENGFMFENSDELATQIKTWFKKFPNNAKQNELVSKFKNNLKTFQNLRWENNWENRAKQFFL